MNVLPIVALLAEETGWEYTYQSVEKTVLEIRDGIMNSRSQFVEIDFVPGGVINYGAGYLPDMIHLLSRVHIQSGDYYEHESEEILNKMLLLTNDFGPFGVMRSHPYFYVTNCLLLSGLGAADLKEIILSLAYVADRIEFNLAETGADDF